ncbi:selenocysteine-specific translation elongation factor [Caldimonas thermodepolymerans]|uniref:selenocysteine-specific translation elongation factor n=1 Tax=Caldimonas thermodepolymerans TaxID=215580 RepID=UPI0022358709|nr:selenocysteine-specific translation elongation factor [Caldimonas thermodepolymerans]UZG45147.1 selenocysteine-specific translation elongation factor [Caldimonas thermodepolymerans]
MIIGTAGHIDHGKTTLVRALTGVDTDRLPEEKKRGISIELGYAFLDVPQSTQRIGFIDVPGHERLVHTMLAGATGIDFGLLLVAADDGVMPQTREHLAVLSLLGVQRGAVVITKADRADADRVAAVRADVGQLLQHSSLQGAPVFALSAHTGEGVEALREHLYEQARQLGERAPDGRAFRLAVDRAFTLDGVGTVVTGTVHAGRVAVGDELVLTPGPGARVRVRSLHAQNRPVEQAAAGQRCAVGLAGIAKQDIERGQWLVHPACALATDRIDATLTLWHEEAKALRSGTPVHVHIGAASVPGSVAVLDRETLPPGETARVQLVLRAPVGAWHGDRVVLRDASASRTLAGGTVLDPFAPVRYRRTAQRLAELDALAQPGLAGRVAGLLAVAPYGVDLRRLAAAQGLESTQPLADVLPAAALHLHDARADLALGETQATAVRASVVEALSAYHQRHPDELGPDAARLRRLAQPRMPEALWRHLLVLLQADGTLAVRGAFVHLPAHGVRLSAVDQRIAQKVAPRLAESGFEGCWARDLARDCGESEPLMRTTLARLAQRGELHQVVKDLYYSVETMAKLAALARQLAGQSERLAVTAAAFRDATGLGRKRAIQILEYFDRIGLLRRVGDEHRLRTDSTLFAEEAA